MPLNTTLFNKSPLPVRPRNQRAPQAPLPAAGEVGRVGGACGGLGVGQVTMGKDDPKSHLTQARDNLGQIL